MDKWSGFAAPIILITRSLGETGSGWYEIARTVSRVFPAHREIVAKVRQMLAQPSSAFPSGPYPTDKLTYKSDSIVEYQTPAKADGLGLGVYSRIERGDTPIDGVAMLIGNRPDLILLSVRLPSILQTLARPIIAQAERDAPGFN